MSVDTFSAIVAVLLTLILSGLMVLIPMFVYLNIIFRCRNGTDLSSSLFRRKELGKAHDLIYRLMDRAKAVDMDHRYIMSLSEDLRLASKKEQDNASNLD